VSPQQGFTDRRLRLVLRGTGFVPSYRIDHQSGRRVGDTAGFWGQVGDGEGRVVALSDFGWRGTGELTAWLDPGLPAGRYRVEVLDPRGQRAVLPDGFEALGTDLTAPTLRIVEPLPGRPIASGMSVPVRLAARDQPPGRLRDVRWRARLAGQTLSEGSCPLQPEPAQVDCVFTVAVPLRAAEGETLLLTATATDDSPAGAPVEAVMTLTLLPTPTVAIVSPTRGGVAGGTDLLIRGRGFLPGSRVLLGGLPLWPDGGIFVDGGTLSGRTPPLGAGPATLQIVTPVGNAPELPNAFSYELPPLLEAITPDEGDPDGGTPVALRGKRFSRDTQFFFGDSLVTAQPLEDVVVVGPEEVKGTTPPGRGRTSIWAMDPDLGWTRRAGAWSWSSR